MIYLKLKEKKSSTSACYGEVSLCFSIFHWAGVFVDIFSLYILSFPLVSPLLYYYTSTWQMSHRAGTRATANENGVDAVVVMFILQSQSTLFLTVQTQIDFWSRCIRISVANGFSGVFSWLILLVVVILSVENKSLRALYIA